MADNVAITAGSGTTIAADDVGGILHQRVKLSLGADGVANDANVGAGVVSTGTLRVTLASDDPAVTALNASNTQLPSALGTTAAASSLGVALSTEDVAKLGSLTETAPTTDTASSGLNGRLQRIAQRITSLIALIPAALGQGTTAQSLKVCLPNDQAASTTVTITRPANTTAYSASDVLGGALTIATGLTSGQNAIITGADLLPEIASIPTGMTSFRLYLYDATPASAIADNGAWTFTSSDWANFLGYVDLGAPVDLGSGLYCQVENVNHQIKLNASTNIYGYLVTSGGFTPAANSEVYLLRLKFLGV